MELTLKVSKDLGTRLRSHESRLAEILELGLEIIESQPTPEELVAYSRGELEAGARADFVERLARDRGAVQDLLDFENLEDLEPPHDTYRLSDRDVDEALETFRGLVAKEDTPDTPGVWQWRLPNPRHRTTWWAVAASLIAVLSLWSSFGRSAGPVVTHGHPIQLSTLRGSPAHHTVPASSETIQLILEPTHLLPGTRGRLVVRGPGGVVVLERTLAGTSDRESLLFVSIPANDLPSGRYRVEIDPGIHGPKTVLDFTLERAAVPSSSRSQ